MNIEVELKAIALPEGSVLLPNGYMSADVSEDELIVADGTTLAAVRQVVANVRAAEVLVLAIPQTLPDDRSEAIVTLSRLVRVTNVSKRVFQGLCRARIQPTASTKQGRVRAVLIRENMDVFPIKLIEKLRISVQNALQRDARLAAPVSKALAVAEAALSPSMLVDAFAGMLPLEYKDKLALLNELSAAKRCYLLTSILENRTSPPPNAERRLVLAGSPMKPVQQRQPIGGPLSRSSADSEEVDELEAKLRSAELQPEGRKIVDRELKRIRRMSPQQAEYQVCRTYLETLADVPWNSRDSVELAHDSVQRTQQCLDEDHYGLERAKKRLVEYVAVSYLRQKRQRTSAESTAPIILLVGPPGVGKTSLAKSVARALNKQLYRISLGGVRDEAEIRGHRRTYIGAMPGVIVQGLRKSGSMNPVLVLDEIDKVGQGVHSVHGDPAAALLEVLDPAQNSTFVDHYIGFPIDLSQVTFIATANTVDTIPGPLLDRMEVINIEGYTYIEKDRIARRYLLPKQLRAAALDPDQLELEPEAMHNIATQYTRESGVRSLERQLGSLCRGWAVEMLAAGDTAQKKVVSAADLRHYLGLPRFHDDIINDKVDEYVDEQGTKRQRHTHGLVNGLAYMGSGVGGLLVFEATQTPNGDGKLQLTGKLGDVISESAHIALSWVRANAHRLGISASDLKTNDIHLHAPAGAVPKEGPSAGVAMTVCFVSLLTHRQVPRDLAMTGEITLRGKILPVGGVREKLLGAHLAGVHRVILPWHCRSVVEEECLFVGELGMEVAYAKYIWDVFAEIWPQDTPFQVSHL